MTNKRVVLAYSGGLDTSVAVRWLGEESGAEVIALAVDVGQGGDFEVLRRRATEAGAVESVVVDARAEMADEFVMPAIRANASYEGKYPLVSALSRPVIVRHLVAAARHYGAHAVAHGCTGKGNDQVRFEVGTRALAPDLEILAPARIWGMSREECDRVRAPPRHSRSRRRRRRSTRSTRTSGAAPSSAERWRIRGTGRLTTLTCSRGRPRRDPPRW